VTRSLPFLVVLALAPASNARAQSSGTMAATVPGCYVLTPYGLVPTCMVPLSAAQQDELSTRAAAYRTDGARVTAAPSAGPAAAYFNNASQVLAAPTTSWVHTVNPELGAGSFGAGSGVSSEKPSASPSASPPPSAVPSAETPPIAASAPSAHGAAMPELTARAAPSAAPATEAEPASASEHAFIPQPAELAAPFPAVWRGEARSSSVGERTGPTAEVPPLILWFAIGTPIVALLVFLGVQAFASRVLRH
jgi:hypothetical protein